MTENDNEDTFKVMNNALNPTIMLISEQKG